MSTSSSISLKGKFWKLHVVLLVGAVLPTSYEALSFLHDRWVVWQDFGCLHERFPTKEQQNIAFSRGGSKPCNIRAGKLSMFSDRAIRNGMPWLQWSMDERLVFWGLLAGLPFLLASVVFLRRRDSQLFRWWRILLALLFLPWVVHLSTSAILPYFEPSLFEVMTYHWWTIRLSSLLYSILLLLFAALVFAWRFSVRLDVDKGAPDT